MSSAIPTTSPLPAPSAHHPTWLPPIKLQPPIEHGAIVFTRQLWQRTMPEAEPSEQPVLDKSRARETLHANHSHDVRSRRRTSSSTASHPSQTRPSSPTPSSKTPLTPEESPPLTSARKRRASIVGDEDKDVETSNSTPVHSRVGSGDSAVQVCICQPDPKIPRPRNAFILYRQHHQASVVAQHPGLANPEISKIIGEQWRNQPAEVKNDWKALAEEEKLRHQQQYPTYRYQPKRNGRRNSLSSDSPLAPGEKKRCEKCGGRSILAPSAPFSTGTSPTRGPLPSTSSSVSTPVTRTLPVLRDLSLQSPAVRRMGRPYQPNNMSPRHHNGHLEERDDLGPLSPDTKRRRFNDPTAVARAAPPRYGGAPPGVAVGPGTPFPFGQAPPQHPYPLAQAAAHIRRESLPGLRGLISPPGPMAPPPRPGMGYQQHRLSQGHVPHDRSLILPPLQTGPAGGVAGFVAKAGAGKTVEELVMNMGFQYKINVLGKIANPAPVSKDAPRGPLIAIEGDSTEAVEELAGWLKETLARDTDLDVRQLDGPAVEAKGQVESAMVEYHYLVGEWLQKSREIVASLRYAPVTPTSSKATDALMSEAISTHTRPSSSTREVDENYDDGDDSSKSSSDMPLDSDKPTNEPKQPSSETMDVDRSPSAPNPPALSSSRPVAIISNFSLHASNVFACRIPITDAYSPSDHWQWSATQWRGTAGPDLTIYVKDAVAGDSGKQSVDIIEEDRVFVVKRTKVEGKEGMEVEAAVLRRLGFEVGEWVRAMGSKGVKQ